MSGKPRTIVPRQPKKLITIFEVSKGVQSWGDGCGDSPMKPRREQPLFVYLCELGRPGVLHGLPEPGARLADPAVAEVLVLLALRLLLLLLEVALEQKQGKK